MTWKRAVARGASELLACPASLMGPRLGFRIFLYHAVGATLAHDTYGFSIRPEMFERHMAALAQAPGVSLVDFHEGLGARASLRVAVTFDDGYKNNLTVAAPILLQYKIPFTVFVTSSFVSQTADLYLTPTELRELAGLPGVTLGSHGMTHVRPAECDDHTLWQELEGSRLALEDLIGKPVTAIAYPHGSVNRRVADMARRAGYTLGACSRFNINDARRDPLLLCRTEVVAADSERVFLQKLWGVWDWQRWRTKDPAI